MVHLRLDRYQDLMLPRDPSGAVLPSTGRGQGITVSLSLEGGIDTLADQARDASAQIVVGPVDRPWNVRELIGKDVALATAGNDGKLASTQTWSEIPTIVRRHQDLVRCGPFHQSPISWYNTAALDLGQ